MKCQANIASFLGVPLKDSSMNEEPQLKNQHQKEGDQITFENMQQVKES